eukprot:s7297_g1.t1
MQATLYGQIKALRLEILERYDVDLSVHSAFFTWLAETDTFVFPQAKRSEEATAVDPSNFEEQQQSTEPLEEVENLLGDDLSDFEPEAVPPRDDLSDLESNR